MEDAETERLFHQCDRGRKGYLTESDLKAVCPQLDNQDIAFIFASLDTDGSGKIEKDEFLHGFLATVARAEQSGCNGLASRASAREEVYESDGNSSRRQLRLETQNRNYAGYQEECYYSESDRERIDFSMPCQDEVIALYEQLQTTGMPQLLGKFERVVGKFCREIQGHKEENERLQHVYTNEKEMYNRRMEDIETEIDEQLLIAERKARLEERDRLEKEKEMMKEKMEMEMREMRDNIDRLQRVEALLEREGQRRGAANELRSQLHEISTENVELRRNMAENQLELAVIKSELAQTRADYDAKRMQLASEMERERAANSDSEQVHKQLQLLFDANRKLAETNETLRQALNKRKSIVHEFHLRSPSPRPSPQPFQSPTQERPSQILLSPTYSTRMSDEEADSGLAMGYESSDIDERTQQKVQFVTPEVVPSGAVAERTFRVVMCGDAAVGKSSLVNRIVNGQFLSNLPSTLGVDFHVKTVKHDGKVVALQLWDTAGQERFRSLCKSYFRRADGAILVYDVSSEQSFLRVRHWMETIQEAVERPIPIVLLANKSDLRDSGRAVISANQGSTLAAKMGVLFSETSALDGNNVDPVVHTLTREMLAVEDVEVKASGVVLTKGPPKKGGCCG
ncbi:unnamed protein product, partial [Mesorhabditis belari]|uniref:EF-hand domain-containing protein n=1 Tax=Mesorhabditis belari TaxID=2138241 RepID=A0AAF3ED26_9BILA